jgi:hypothetical protein
LDARGFESLLRCWGVAKWLKAADFESAIRGFDSHHPYKGTFMKVIVTGDRNWMDLAKIREVLSQFPADTRLIHGGCRGADEICGLVGKELGFDIVEYPANWELYGKSAGPKRNQLMIDEGRKTDDPELTVCYAFHNDIKNSKGTKDMMRRTIKAGIKTYLVMSMSVPVCILQVEKEI